MNTTKKLLFGIVLVLGLIALLKFIEPKEVIILSESGKNYLTGVIRP